jgi:hypothetical protein
MAAWAGSIVYACGVKGREIESKPGANPMYDFRIQNSNADVVIGRLERFFKVAQNNFIFKTHKANRGVVKFYSAGDVGT